MTTIMRQTLFAAALLLFFVSCNNDEQSVTKQDNTMPAKEKELRDAIAAYPDSIPLLKSLIKYYEDIQAVDLAMTAIDNTLKKDSNDADLWDRKASIFIYNDDTVNALKSYNKAIDIFPDPQYIMAAGLLYAFKKNDTALAMSDGLLIGKNAHAEKEALLIKGIYYKEINEKQKAITFFDKCLEISYTYISGYLQKGITLFEMGKYKESIKVFAKATTLQNNFDEGYYWLGKCYEKLKKTDAAIESYKTALLYNPDYTEAKDALGKLGVK
jgi:tetratricopeptide (TPR) repeat protein